LTQPGVYKNGPGPVLARPDPESWAAGRGPARPGKKNGLGRRPGPARPGPEKTGLDAGPARPGPEKTGLAAAQPGPARKNWAWPKARPGPARGFRVSVK